MKQLRQILVNVVLTLATLSHYTYAQKLAGVSFFSPRSQSVNAARELAGWHPYINRCGTKHTNAAFTLTPEFTRSYKSIRMAQTLFGADTLSFSGSIIPNRSENAILADYFGLSPAFQSDVLIKPWIQNNMLVFNGYLGLDSFLEGLYLRIHAPGVWTKWEIELEETVFNNGSSTPFPAQYMAANEINAPVNSFKDAIKGGFTFGDMQEPLAFGKINGSQTKAGLSDLQCALGYNFVLQENGHAGFNIRVAMPTGSRPNSEFLFEPIIGNAKHWELGIGFTGRVVIWEKDGQQEVSFFADANLTHIFDARQKRSFDLTKNGFGSRYILAKEFDAERNYTGKLVPLINRTTLSCDVSNALQLDVAIMFGYTYHGFVFDVGYNGWIRSKENISLKESIKENNLGLKGVQNVRVLGNELSNATQSTATLMGNNLANQALVADERPPVFITQKDLDLRSAASPRLVTHKLFTHIGYGWEKDERNVTPFVGIGGEIEFQGFNPRGTFQFDRTTASQWGVWLKGGFAI